MAGQPRTRAKRFADWEERLWQLFVEFSELAPRRPTSPPNPSEIDYWAELHRNLTDATCSASEVLSELERKAGLNADELDEERAVKRGLWDLDDEDVSANAEVVST